VTDITGIALPIPKHNYLVMHLEALAELIREGFWIARSGRPVTVRIDIPKDVQIAPTQVLYPEDPIVVTSARAGVELDTRELAGAAQLILESKRPFILAVHGISLAQAEREFNQFVEKTCIPVALTLLGKGVIAESHPLCLGMMGMHGEAFVNNAIQEADLLIALGMRFDDRVTGDLRTYAPNARKIHVDIDASEINKNVRV